MERIPTLVCPELRGTASRSDRPVRQRRRVDLVIFEKGKRKYDVALRDLSAFSGEGGCCSSAKPKRRPVYSALVAQIA